MVIPSPRRSTAAVRTTCEPGHSFPEIVNKGRANGALSIRVSGRLYYATAPQFSVGLHNSFPWDCTSVRHRSFCVPAGIGAGGHLLGSKDRSARQRQLLYRDGMPEVHRFIAWPTSKRRPEARRYDVKLTTRVRGIWMCGTLKKVRRHAGGRLCMPKTVLLERPTDNGHRSDTFQGSVRERFAFLLTNDIEAVQWTLRPYQHERIARVSVLHFRSCCMVLFAWYCPRVLVPWLRDQRGQDEKVQLHEEKTVQFEPATCERHYGSLTVMARLPQLLSGRFL